MCAFCPLPATVLAMRSIQFDRMCVTREAMRVYTESPVTCVVFVFFDDQTGRNNDEH